MAIIDDDSFHWAMNRIAVVFSFAFLAVNLITIVLLVVMISGSPTRNNENILSLIVGKLDEALFFVLFSLMALSCVLWLANRLRVQIRSLVPWLVGNWVIAGICWWVISMLATHGSIT
ncbi:MAG: hypothetical protein V1778_01420 [bacterium]